jgi:uncharacterized cupredoxin-like copper-binding protein
MALLLLAAACGGGAGGTVSVTLQEFSVIPAQNSVSAGDVTFRASNKGPKDNHELVVIKTDLAPDALPTTSEAGVDEKGAGIQVIGEIEEFAPGQSKTASFDLEAGKYVLICNVVETEGGKPESHYKNGMRIGLTVT